MTLSPPVISGGDEPRPYRTYCIVSDYANDSSKAVHDSGNILLDKRRSCLSLFFCFCHAIFTSRLVVSMRLFSYKLDITKESGKMIVVLKKMPGKMKWIMLLKKLRP